ncbi:MAG: CarD family transcriptional regulator [Lachnospiraceae bacterium]|nr:CarD family transcriptional regulator [Lachnospiraceae bacterium]
MFEKGEFIIYETAGVCKVADINTVDMKGIDRKKLFYFLEPVGIKGNRLYIPVENHKSLLRKLVSKEEADELLENVDGIGTLPIPDYKHREESYKTALKSCDCKEWMKMVHTLYQKRAELAARGKKLPSMDSRYLKIAQECLFTELSIVSGQTEASIESQIAEKVLGQ